MHTGVSSGSFKTKSSPSGDRGDQKGVFQTTITVGVLQREDLCMMFVEKGWSGIVALHAFQKKL